MPSSKKARAAIFSLVPKNPGKVYELGSGWGHLLKRGAPCHAFELSPLPYLFSKLVCRGHTIERKDFFKKDLSDANVIVCYLFPGAMQKLKAKFEMELKPGTTVISNTFAIPGWEPASVTILNDLWQTPIYLYTFGDS